MNSAMDRLRHGLFQGNAFAARAIERCTSLIFCSRSVQPLLPSFPRVRRNLSMRLKVIAFTQKLETDNRMLASQKNSFSCLVRDQNLASRLIFHPQQTFLEKGVEEGQGLLLARG